MAATTTTTSAGNAGARAAVVTVACPHCGRTFPTSPERFQQINGRRAKCKRCNEPFTVAAIAAAKPKPPAKAPPTRVRARPRPRVREPVMMSIGLGENPFRPSPPAALPPPSPPSRPLRQAPRIPPVDPAPACTSSAAPPRAAPPSPAPPHPASPLVPPPAPIPQFRCHACRGWFGADACYTLDDRYVCKRCHAAAHTPPPAPTFVNIPPPGATTGANARAGTASPASDAGPVLIQNFFHAHKNVVHPPPRWSPGLAALLSFVLPGLGHMYKGHVANGLAWLLLVCLGYAALVLPGVVLHVCCVLSASRGDPYR